MINFEIRDLNNEYFKLRSSLKNNDRHEKSPNKMSSKENESFQAEVSK